MDKQTREYMRERVEKYDRITETIRKCEKTIERCMNPADGDVPRLYMNGNYYQVPEATLAGIANLIGAEITKQEEERERI